MASLYEYFVKDGATTLKTRQTWSIADEGGAISGEVIACLHLDFEANAKYISFYIPKMDDVVLPEAIALRGVNEILAWPNTIISIQAGFAHSMDDGNDLNFTGRIHIYSERPVPAAYQALLVSEGNSLGYRLKFRSVEHMDARNQTERPRAFISHDSRDKSLIAEPLALALQKAGCPVWYDEFSLKVGDSLRDSIEAGLRECERCVLILTPNFLSNGGWSKKEYDSIFTRELVNKSRVILPIWDGVTARDVYEYSPSLADRVAVEWHRGLDHVVRKLMGALR